MRSRIEPVAPGVGRIVAADRLICYFHLDCFAPPVYRIGHILEGAPEPSTITVCAHDYERGCTRLFADAPFDRLFVERL